MQVDGLQFELASSTISAKGIGVHQVTNTISCVSCKKQVIPCPDDGLLGTCETCNMVQILDACAMQWLFRLLVQNSTNPAEKRRLVFQNQEVKQLLEILDIPDDINTLSERGITLKILQANKEIKVTFDSITYKVTDIANINIFKLFANYTNFIIGRTLVTIFNNLTFFLIPV